MFVCLYVNHKMLYNLYISLTAILSLQCEHLLDWELAYIYTVVQKRWFFPRFQGGLTEVCMSGVLNC